MTGAARAEALGLDPAGYRDAHTGDVTPWDEPIEGDYTMFEHLTDLAGSEGADLVEYLGYRGIGPESEADPDDNEDDDY